MPVYDDTPDYVKKYESEMIGKMLHKMRLTYKQAWDFEDYQGWVAYLGESEEATITWRSRFNDMVVNGECEPGYSWMTTAYNGSIVSSTYPSLYSAQVALEKEIFKGVAL